MYHVKPYTYNDIGLLTGMPAESVRGELVDDTPDHETVKDVVGVNRETGHTLATFYTLGDRVYTVDPDENLIRRGIARLQVMGCTRSLDGAWLIIPQLMTDKRCVRSFYTHSLGWCHIISLRTDFLGPVGLSLTLDSSLFVGSTW